MTVTAPALWILAAAASWAGAAMMWRFSLRLGFTDAPNERSSHSTPTPRGGGAGFAFAVPALTAFGFASAGTLRAGAAVALAASAAVAAVGLVDDRWTLPTSARLFLQLVLATLVVSTLPQASPSWLAYPLAVIWVVALTNVFNFMDGIDGIAGVQAVVAAVSLAALGAANGRGDVVTATVMIAVGVAAFLPLNWPPARVFMGDVGSTFLGFTFGCWSLRGAVGTSRIPILATAVVLSPFLYDAGVTLLRRVYNRDRFWQAHRTHIYQRLVQTGWSHRRTTLLYGALACWQGGATLAFYTLHVLSPPAYALLVLAPLLIPHAMLRRERRAHPK